MATTMTASKADVTHIKYPIDDDHRAMLRASSFSTLEEAYRFRGWYEGSEHHTGWDDTRYWQARQLIAHSDQPANAAEVAEPRIGDIEAALKNDISDLGVADCGLAEQLVARGWINRSMLPSRQSIQQADASGELRAICKDILDGVPVGVPVLLGIEAALTSPPVREAVAGDEVGRLRMSLAHLAGWQLFPYEIPGEHRWCPPGEVHISTIQPLPDDAELYDLARARMQPPANPS
jgi:hypothetical protein